MLRCEWSSNRIVDSIILHTFPHYLADRQATETSCVQLLPEFVSRVSATRSPAVVPAEKGPFPWMSTRGSAHSSIAACVRVTARTMALHSSVLTGDTRAIAATVDCRTIAIRGAQIRQIKSVVATWKCHLCHRTRTRRAHNFTVDTEEHGTCQCPILMEDDAVHSKASIGTSRISISAAADIDDGTGEVRPRVKCSQKKKKRKRKQE